MLQIRRRRLIIAGLVVLGLTLVGIVLLRLFRPIKQVTVVQPQRREVVELVIATGRLRAIRQSNIGSQVQGTVESVFVDEGDKVTVGQVLIILERSEQLQSVRRAELAAQTARAQLIQTRRGAYPEDIARARAEVSQARRVNGAKLAAAQERLRELQRGGRPAERRRAEAQLAQARAARVQAQADLNRARRLFGSGAISRADLDKAQATADQTRAAENAARQQLLLARQPASREQIAAAQADVQAARATLEESVRIAQQDLQRLLNLPRLEDVRVAESRVNEADAAVRAARDELAKRIIRSPLNGLVVTRSVEPGQSVNPGTTLLTVADMSRTEIYVETDEVNLPKLRPGQLATIVAPAYQQNPFNAVLTRVGPEIDTERGVVVLRLKPTSLPPYARPDITVDAYIEVGRFPNALAVPNSALIEEGERTYVFVVESRRAVRRSIRVLGRGQDYAAVEGVSTQDRVITEGTAVQDGQRVRAAEE
ncbi:MAG: efflux RND transporter periplasmic adaptor subunit [Armatimonadota bacterium]|nr:efflux RND transporter periplasmic adaptor subunit [bacterium]